MTLIAGHNFNAGHLGNRCSNLRNLTLDGVTIKVTCGRNIVDILNTAKNDIGKMGIACYDGANIGLTATEYQQIEAERERIWNTMKHPNP